MQCEGEAGERRKGAFRPMASDGARPQVRRPDHRVAPPPGRALNIAATGTGTTPASFSSVSVSVRGGAGSLSFPFSTSAASSLDHKPLLAPTPFILGKRICTDDDTSAKDDGISVGPAVGSLVGPRAPAGLWTLSARPDFGQIWSFAAAAPPLEMVVQLAAVPVSQQQQASLFVHHQHQQQQQAMREASITFLDI